MSQKKSLLLDEIIREYLRHQEPIGSESLRLSLGIKISSATIRNYFKVLVTEGALAQPHVSSGRIPTEWAMREYWRRKLLPLGSWNLRDIQEVRQAASSSGLFCALRLYPSNTLQETLVSSERKYLILVFEEGETIVKYSAALERFLNDLLHYEIRDIQKIAHQVCANELSEKLKSLMQTQESLQLFGVHELIKIECENHHCNDQWLNNILQGRWLDSLEEGLYFDHLIPKGNLAIIHNIKVKGKPTRLMVIGALHRDYEHFYGKNLA